MEKRTDGHDRPADPVRRAVVRGLIAAPVIGWVGFAAASRTSSMTANTQVELAPTLACGDDDDEPTPSQTEGPYFTPRSPERASLLEAGIRGPHLILTGQVLSTLCDPVAGALLDFWQADTGGQYDNTGYKLRGHQFTGPDGRFELQTIVPGLYSGRTRHIHVKVQAPGGRVLTTQLYFPWEAANRRDGIYSPKLLMAVVEEGEAQRGLFNFVIRA
jgi:protocatechuate 3,4-dioxygenase beta subunit